MRLFGAVGVTRTAVVIYWPLAHSDITLRLLMPLVTVLSRFRRCSRSEQV